MQFTTESLIVAGSLATAVSASASAQVTPSPSVMQAYSNNTQAVYTTETVTGYVTFCPSATTFVENKKTYTATKSEWVTVTHCPNQCTITHLPGPSATIIPILPPAQNMTTPVVKPTVVPTTIKSVVPVPSAPTKNQTLSVVKPTTVAAQKPAFTPGAYVNSTLPMPSLIPVGTGALPLTTLTTTNAAGKTVTSVGVVQGTGSVVYPLTTITTTNSAGKPVTSVGVAGSVATVVTVPAATIVGTNSVGSATTEYHPASVVTTSAVTIPAQTILTQGQSGQVGTSTAAATTITGSAVTQLPKPSVVQTAGAYKYGASAALAFGVAGVVAFFF